MSKRNKTKALRWKIDSTRAQLESLRREFSFMSVVHQLGLVESISDFEITLNSVEETIRLQK